MDLVLLSAVLTSFFLPGIDGIKLTASNLPHFKHPCAYDNPKRATQCTPKRKLGTDRGFTFGKIGSYNNFFCKLYGMCVGLTTGTVFLTAEMLWRQKGLVDGPKRSFPRRETYDTVKHWYNSGDWKPYSHDRKKKKELEEQRKRAAEEEKKKKEEREEEKQAEQEDSRKEGRLDEGKYEEGHD